MRTHGPAFLLSALIHLGLLAFLFVGISLLPHEGPPETPVAVSLQMFQPPPAPSLPEPLPTPPEPVVEPPPEAVEPPPPPPAPKPKPKPPGPKPKPPEPKPPPPKPKPPPKPQPQAPKPKAPVPKAQTPVVPQPPKETPVLPQPATDASLLRRVEEAYKIALRKAIEAHKIYPRRAARLHQEGEVMVGFTVRRDGGIADLRVVQSAGSALLDRAALEAVRQIDGALPFPAEIERSEWAFSLPISYTLR